MGGYRAAVADFCPVIPSLSAPVIPAKAGIQRDCLVGALARRRRGLDARDTLTLALSHKGRGDPLTAIRT